MPRVSRADGSGGEPRRAVRRPLSGERAPARLQNWQNFAQLRGIDRFSEVVIHPIKGLRNALTLMRCSCDGNQNDVVTKALAHDLCECQAVHPRHADVEDHAMGAELRRNLQCLYPIAGRPNLIAVQFEQDRHCICNVGHVIDDEYARFFRGSHQPSVRMVVRDAWRVFSDRHGVDSNEFMTPLCSDKRGASVR